MAKQKSPRSHSNRKQSRLNKFTQQQNEGPVGLNLIPLIAKSSRPKGRIIHRFQLHSTAIKPLRDSSKSRPSSREHSPHKKRHRHSSQSGARHRKNKSPLGFIVKEIPSLESLANSIKSTRHPSLSAINEGDMPPECGDTDSGSISFYNPDAVTAMDIEAILASYEGVYSPKVQSNCSEEVEEQSFSYNDLETPSRDFDDNGSPVLTAMELLSSSCSHRSRRAVISGSHCSEDREGSRRSKRSRRSSHRSREHNTTPLANCSDDIEDNASSKKRRSRRAQSYVSNGSVSRPKTPASVNSDEAEDVNSATGVANSLALALVKVETQSSLSSSNSDDQHDPPCFSLTQTGGVASDESQLSSPGTDAVLAIRPGEDVEETDMAVVAYNPLPEDVTSSNDGSERAVSVGNSNDGSQKDSSIGNSNSDLSEKAVSVVSSNNELLQEAVPIVNSKNDLSQKAVPVVNSKNDLSQEVVPVVNSKNDLSQKAVPVVNSKNDLSQKAVPVVNSKNDLSQKAVLVVNSNSDLSQKAVLVVNSNNDLSQKAVLVVNSNNDLSHKAVLVVNSNNDIPQKTTSVTGSNEESLEGMEVIRSAISLSDSMSVSSEREITSEDFNDSSYTTEEYCSSIAASLSSSEGEDTMTEIYEPPPALVALEPPSTPAVLEPTVSDSDKPKSLDGKSRQQGVTKLPPITEQQSKELGGEEEKMEAGSKIKQAWRTTYANLSRTQSFETQLRTTSPESHEPVSASPAQTNNGTPRPSEDKLGKHKSLISQGSGARIKETLRVFMENKDRARMVNEARRRRLSSS